MTYTIGIVLTQGSPIVIKTDSEEAHKGILEQLREKNTLVELEQEGVLVSIRTSNITKVVSGEGEDFDVQRHL